MEPHIDIDMMPLTSMALIILLILMTMSPGITKQRNDVKIPAAETAEREKASPVTVTLLVDGRIEVSGKETDISGLGLLLSEKLKTSPESILLIRADRNLLYSDIEPVLQIGTASGARKIAIGAEKKK